MMKHHHHNAPSSRPPSSGAILPSAMLRPLLLFVVLVCAVLYLSFAMHHRYALQQALHHRHRHRHHNRDGGGNANNNNDNINDDAAIVVVASDDAVLGEMSREQILQNMTILTTDANFKIACPQDDKGSIKNDVVCSEVQRTGGWEQLLLSRVEALMTIFRGDVSAAGAGGQQQPNKQNHPRPDRVPAEDAADPTKKINLAERGLFIDIGSNVGYWSFRMALVSDTVLSIDANSNNVRAMTASKLINSDLPHLFDHVKIIKQGISDVEDRQCVLVGPVKQNINNHEVECNPDIVSQPIGYQFGRGGVPARFAEDHLEVRSTPLNVTTLDAVLKKKLPNFAQYGVRIVKIDVESFEINVLRGGMSLFKQASPQVVIAEQWRIGDTANFLRKMIDLGYTVITGDTAKSLILPPSSFQQYVLGSMGDTENFIFLRNNLVEQFCGEEKRGERECIFSNAQREEREGRLNRQYAVGDVKF